jgi:MIP family channel proteins
MGLQPGDFTLKTWRAGAAEFIATGLFVFIGTGAVVVAINSGAAVVNGGNAPTPAFVVSVALAHGLAIALLVAATAKISGGHINPAVSFAAALTGKIKVSTGALYVAAQLIGAVLASLALKAVIAGPYEMGLGAHGLNKVLLYHRIGSGAGAGLLVEVILTFTLVFVIFATAIDPKGLGHLGPAAIGLAVLVDHLIGVPLTGASMNPARSFGPALVANQWADHWVYWLGPLIGAGIAALAYEFVFLHREE